MSSLSTQLKKQKLIGSQSDAKGRYYVIQLGDEGHSAILFSSAGKVLNTINGDSNDSGAVVERAARKAWPDASRRELRGVPKRAKAGDEVAARELVLFTENEARLWGPGNTQGESIRKNLTLKAQKGTLDPARAPKLFEYLMKSAADLYGKEYGGSFDAPTRRLAAQDMAESFLEELSLNPPPSKPHSGRGFYLWVTAVTPNKKLPTSDGKPLTEKEATVLASKFDPSRRIVVRPASYKPGQSTSHQLRKSGVSEESLLNFKKVFAVEITRAFDTGHPLFIAKTRLNSGGYAPDHGDSYFGVNRPGQVLFEIHDNKDSVFARAPDKKTVVAALRDLGFQAS